MWPPATAKCASCWPRPRPSRRPLPRSPFWILLLVSRSTTRSALQALAMAERIAGGDLRTEPVTAGKDELGQMLTALGP